MQDNISQPPHDAALADPVAFGRIMMDVSQRSQEIFQAFLERKTFDFKDPPVDPLNLSPALIQMMGRFWENPQKAIELQARLWQDWMTLWQESAKKFNGQDARTLYEPDQGDRRFKSPAWRDSALFDYIKQSYLMTSRWLQDAVRTCEADDPDEQRKIEFATRQFIDAMAPTNFLLTNPDALQATIDSNGDNLLRGLEHMLADLERGRGVLKISTTDPDAFEIGRNIAVTPGKVVWRNDLMELIQYAPSTDMVAATPLLVIPPWINKYYILDLKPDNSFIRWLVAQGHTVFIISWVNPDNSYAGKTFDDYMRDGLLTAMEQMRKATGEDDCNLVGYCLGGTLVAMTLAWLAAKGRGNEVKSATFLTTLIDFSEAGDLKLFMDDAQLARMEQDMAEKGFLDAESFRRTFALLRANDMVWSFVVNNYLMGKEPFPFDLLHWNEDATNMPAAMHRFYLRSLYRDNLLAQPGGVEINGEALDMRDVKTPSYFISTREDHIAPWRATYAATQLFAGPVTFTLAASGHVAGVVNPPDKNKYCHWTSSAKAIDPEQWLDSAEQKDGSWWTDWAAWIRQHAGRQVAARGPGTGKNGKALDDAPGQYVRKAAG